MKETIFVFSAHTDDFVLGAGGMIANYAQNGKKVITVVFSLGEMSHPWMKRHVIQKTRRDETLAAGKVLNTQIIFLNLKDTAIGKDYEEKNTKVQLLKSIKKEKPQKIFTHSGEDPHPDHRSVNKISLEIWEELEVKPEMYIYSVWNPVSFKTSFPSLYVNITAFLKIKLNALKLYKSQQFHIAYPTLLLFYKALKCGIKIRTWFAERFFRIK